MRKLTDVMTSLDEARTNKDAAKERWLTAIEDGNENAAALKQAFHAADDIWASGRQTLTDAINDLKTIFCFELALSQLDREETLSFRKLIADLRLDYLTDPYQAPAFNELAETWYRAEGMREAAKTMLDRFNNRDENESIKTIQVDLEHARKPEAWSAAISAYNFFLRILESQGSLEGGDALTSTVLHFLNRHLLKQFDGLTEKLADKLEDAYYAGNITDILEDLEPSICRVIQDAISSGLIRQRQEQVEEEPEARGVIVADPLEDLDEEQMAGPDFGSAHPSNN